MSETQEMVQLSGPIRVTSEGSYTIAASTLLTTQDYTSAVMEKRELPSQLKIKRQASMENLQDSGVDQSGDDEDLDFSDYDELFADRYQAKDTDSRAATKTAVTKPTRAKLTKTMKREDEDPITKDHRELQRAHSELLGELRSTHRENRDQSLELRDVKKQNAQLREAYNKLYNEVTEDPQKLSRREKNKYHEHFQMMEQHISYLQHELEKRDNHIEMLTKQTREANHEKDELDGGNRRLQRQIEELSANLTECKDDLLRLQPTSQTSDSEIAERYSNLCQQIAGWVDDQTEDAETLEERFEGLNTIADLNLDQTLAPYVREEHLRLAQEHPDSVPLLLQYLIHCYVMEYILGDSIFFYGLDNRNVSLLQQMEEGMKLLEPKRDAITLRRWRTEALHGLLKLDEFAATRAVQSQALAKSLYSALAHMLGGADVTVPDEGWEELHKQVFSPAVELATAIRISMSDYKFEAKLFNKAPEKANSIYHNEIQHYQLIDNATHKIVRPDSALKIADDGRIGDELLVVSPALLRKRDEDHKAIICKPTILIKLDQPMEKRNRGFKGLMTGWLGGDGGGVD